MNSEHQQWSQHLNTYLGQKGYTILKSELSIKHQQSLKEKLMVKPYCPGSPVQSQITFPAYRESDKKLYIPRYFGEEIFGPAKQYKISEGDNITIDFQGVLRDSQVPVIETYLKHVDEGGGGLLELPCGFGKTSIALHLISCIKKKTLVIVHKEFLMNQWIERIHQFLPGSKIGKIQGQIIDIDGKDIVIAMLQSLSMKEYPITLFDSFGLTIIDEVHHISSEVFSCALFKLVTKYMLGLSATMNRKDGTSKVFKMFLGPVVYKQERSKDEIVVVRGITYQHPQDDDYNKVEVDYKGNTMISKMISKICLYNHRSEFILKIIKDMLLENPKQQIMIIAQYKNILKYLFDAITHRDISTVGYYVGGMKESALKESESKQIVLATYTMAAEGLDIKTLSTLFMVTPMTNIEQSVGRILRQKHDFDPVVVDIIDMHDNFQKQWIKRKKFYKTQNYKIIQTNSSYYTPDISNWKTTYMPIKNCIKKDLDLNFEEEVEELEEELDNPKDKNSRAGVCLLKHK
jgi:superfamily II DNA or RNA helicase